jgi:hypothetical protein
LSAASLRGSYRQMKKIALRPLLALLPVILLLGQISTLGWGNAGHTDINMNAARKIPDSMPAFLRTESAIARIAYLGPEPDRWRGMAEYALNNAQAPDHFIDLERLQDLGDLPRGRYEFYRLLYKKRAGTATNPDDYLPEHVGLQPYIMMEVFERLRAAFRDYRGLKAAKQSTDPVEQDIIFYAGWLGHYVADGSQPLHTTVNYDGWIEDNPQGFTTAHSIHKRFESDFVGQNIKSSDFASMIGSPSRVEDPFKRYQQYLWSSHALVPKVYELDKAHGFDGAGSPEALKFTEERLAAAGQMLLNLWYTAWMESAEGLASPDAEN